MLAPSLRCRPQPLAVAFLLVACIAGHACGSCLSYGHSCWGAHGKRSGGPGSEDHLNDDLLDSDGSSMPLPPLSPRSSSPATSDHDALWIITKLMATARVEPGDGSGNDDLFADSKTLETWQRMLDVNKGRKIQGTPQVARTGKTSMHFMESGSAPSAPDFEEDGGVPGMGLITRASVGGRRGILVMAEDPEEKEEGVSREEESSSGEETEEQGMTAGGSRKTPRRLRILKLWDNMAKVN